METINNKPNKEILLEKPTNKEIMLEERKKPAKKDPDKKPAKKVESLPVLGTEKEVKAIPYFKPQLQDRYEEVLDNNGRVKKVDRNAKKKRMIHPDMLDPIKRAHDSELVTGVFKYYELQGGTFEFWDRLPYVGEKMRRFKLKDGETAQIPRHTADKLRNGGKYPIHTDMYDASGKRTTRVGDWIDRFDFFETNRVFQPQNQPILKATNL